VAIFSFQLLASDELVTVLHHFSFTCMISFKFAESVVCTAIVLFEFACFIRHDDNTKGKETHGDSFILCLKQFGYSVSALEYESQKPSCY
jgi:hypothetical protein